jgi:hypothetical protein
MLYMWSDNPEIGYNIITLLSDFHFNSNCRKVNMQSGIL